jgi:hypothetical protein
MRRYHRESGSALLIVFLFAAIVAIMLYRELPVTVFEARREKEQLLIDRGQQYVRAIQLYYRRFKPRYPPSIEALENTNRIRFLRHRFKDPFTGKDDWRLIHTNGLALIDSKVNALQTPGSNASSANRSQSASNRAGSPWFTTGSADHDWGFGSDSSDQTSDQEPEVVVPPVPVRPPAIRASAAETAQNEPQDMNANMSALPLDESQKPADLSAATPPQTISQSNGAASNPNPMQMVRNMLSSEGPLAPQQATSGPAVVGGVMIAGVASKASGKSIKVVNDQTDYSHWEFVYDPTKDRTGTPGAVVPVGTGMQAGANASSSGAATLNPSVMPPSSNFAPANSGTINFNSH